MSTIWYPNAAIDLGPLEGASDLWISCDACRKPHRRLRALFVADTEFSLCGRCLKRVAKVASRT